MSRPLALAAAFIAALVFFVILAGMDAGAMTTCQQAGHSFDTCASAVLP